MTLVCFAPYTMLMHNNTRSSGFTIIELVVVIIVLGILVGITVVSYNGAQGRARDADRRADIASLTKALEAYYSDTGQYPTTAGTTATITTNWIPSTNTATWSTNTAPASLKNTLASIISVFPVDPRNNGTPNNNNQFGYAYYSGTGCGKAAGQWYLLVYRFEGSAKERFSDGDTSACAAGDGDNFFTAGANYYRVIK